METIWIFGIAFLLIMIVGFILALSDKGDQEDHSSDELPHVIVTQRVPSVFGRKDHRGDR